MLCTLEHEIHSHRNCVSSAVFPSLLAFFASSRGQLGRGNCRRRYVPRVTDSDDESWPGSKKRKTDTMYEALENGVLSSAEYEVRDVVEIEEFEDEGRHYLLDIGDGKTLMLSGQYLYAPVESGKFPSSRIRVFWHRTEGYTFGIECLGNKMLPSKTIKPIAEDGNEDTGVPGDRELLDQPLGKVAALIEASA